MLFLIKRSHFQKKKKKNFEKSIVIEEKTLPLQSIWRFRSSVGLEQQPSKLWVLGSNPNGITKGSSESKVKQNKVKEDSTSVVSSLLLIYS